MIHIAHLSDIHFGKRFSKATWDSVADEVIRFDPDVIVVSGDMVDDPSPAHLLAARCALWDLSKQAREKSNERANGVGRAAELIFVAGNHDVFESGVAAGQSRLNWFERIFHAAETTRAEEALKSKLGTESLAFEAACLGFPVGMRPQDVSWGQGLKARLGAAFAGRARPRNEGDDFTTHLGAVDPASSVKKAEHSSVLFALLDSNPRHRGLDTATGVVDNDQLIGLRAKLAAEKEQYIARIAVVHHHVLPIAFAARGDTMVGEPMMVLRNAGAVLRTLADHKFDLILHGHWHKPQFARIDFGNDDMNSYPIAVASAGSAAMVSADNPSANSINLITIAETGRISVKSVYYGGPQSPNPGGVPGRHYNRYDEPLSAAKRRALVRARERHGIECDEREQVCEITENGDLWVTHRVEGLRIRGELPRYPRRPLGVHIPQYGHFVHDTLRLDDSSFRAGMTLSEAPDHPNAREREAQYYWINLPGDGLVRGGTPVNFAIHHGCANCMKMTLWEARERVGSNMAPPPGFDSEWVGARISFPTRKLILKAKFPPSLAMVQSRVECYRHRQYPRYNVDDWEDAELDPMNMVVDREAQEEERQHLRYDAPTRSWILEIDQPIVGYHYSIGWQVPGEDPVEEWEMQIAGNTLEWRRVLLNLGVRVDQQITGSNDGEGIKQFDLLCRTLEAEVCQGGPDEKWIIALFIYDSERLALRPILSRRSWTTKELPRNFQMAYGDGVGGAAFQQRRIVAWGGNTGNPGPAARSLITPVPFPDEAGPTEMVNILALPVYHTGMEDLRRPPPWAAIGVVTIGSSSYASPIAGMKDAERRRLRAAAQVQMDSIVHALQSSKPESKK